jgi:uncharacterized damage-inducible protein DinB
MSKSLLTSLVHYNIWANNRIIKSILDAGETISEMEMNSSFSSVRKTLNHIYDAENTWLLRLQNLPYTWPPSKNFNGSLEDFCNHLLQNSEAFKNYVQTLHEDDFDKLISYQNSKRLPFESSVRDMVMHCINHSTYHRGQLVTMLRIAGHTTFQPLDYIAFMR